MAMARFSLFIFPSHCSVQCRWRFSVPQDSRSLPVRQMRARSFRMIVESVGQAVLARAAVESMVIAAK
jgi:hypothetical protein